RVVLPHVTLYCLVIQSTSHGLDALVAVTPLDSRLQARYHGALTADLRFQSLNATVHLYHPIHTRPQRLVLLLPPLGLGAGGGELVFQAPLFGVGRCALLDGHPFVGARVLEAHATIWAPLRHVRHRRHLPLKPPLAQLRPSGTPVRDRRYANGSADTNGLRLVQTRRRLGGSQPPAPRCGPAAPGTSS